ncbi:MAG: serine hydrolase [Clostridia bacterium]|nr:serine hydrolase [Clostridia bacterium]
MTTIDPKQARIVSAVAIAVTVILSGWSGYKHIGSIPTLAESGVETEAGFSGEPEVGPTDIDMFVSDSDLTADIPAEAVSSDEPRSPAEMNRPEEEKATLRYVRITKTANVRDKDEENAKVLSVLAVGKEAQIVEESKLRYRVKYSGNKSGWIYKTCGDVFEKEVVIKHVPLYQSGDPIKINGTKEGDEIGVILSNHSTVGASVAIIKDGKVAYHYEYGYANKEKKIKVGEHTKFRIASISKVVTSMMAMTEVDDGKLDLDGNLSDIMGFKFYNPSHSDKKVTMRMLLTHTSGLIDRDNEYYMVLRDITHNSEFYVSPPGVKFLYCNLGVGIAGAVVEKTADKTISQYAGEKFFEPMSIDASFDAKYLTDKSLVANCYEAGKLSRDSDSLCRSKESGKPGDVFHLGQGGLLISSVDLARVFTILINEGQYEGNQYISRNSLDEMLREQIDSGKGFKQCIGLRKSDKLVGKRQMYFHNGASYGIYALAAFDPADRSGIVIITSGAFTNRNKNTVFAVCDEVMNYSYENILS